MSIDFSGITAVSDQNGVVTQIADASGNVLWSAWKTSGNVILEVEKITSDTYSGNTTYSGEEFVLLDIYPKSGGTVSVTYGGLTKTITDDGTSEEPNAQQVFFGTFNGVSDDVETPSSGTLTIEGDYAAFGCSSCQTGKYSATRCSCVTAISDFGVVEYIPGAAFLGCTKITKVKIPSSVTSIGYSAFSGCSGLTSVTIPSSVISISSSAFYNCTGLTSITIPEAVTSIGDSAFSGCSGLTSILVDSGNEQYSSDGGILFNKDKTVLCAYPAVSGHYTIPEGVTSIGNYAFYNCSGLTSITIPEAVTSIGNSAFSGCSGLTSVTIPSSVISISNSAFSGCSGLTSVTIPSSVISISNAAFYNCTGLTSITIPEAVTSIGDSAFSGCSGLTSATFNNTSGWYVTTTSGATSGTDVDVTDTAANVTMLTNTYKNYYWYRAA